MTLNTNKLDKLMQLESGSATTSAQAPVVESTPKKINTVFEGNNKTDSEKTTLDVSNNLSECHTEPQIKMAENEETAIQSNEFAKEQPKTEFEAYAMQQGYDKDATIEDVYQKLIQKQKNNQPLTETELKLVDEYQAHYQNNDIQKAEAEKLQTIKEYTKISFDKKLEPKEKTHKVLDMYLSENSPEYNNLKNEKEKEQYRQNYINQFSELLAIKVKPKTEKGKKEVENTVLKNISILVSHAAINKENIDNYLTNNNLKEDLHKIKAQIFQGTIKAIGLDDTSKDSKEVLQDAVKMLLTLTDDNFENLSEVDQQKKIEETLYSSINKFLGFDLKNMNLSETEEQNVLNATRSMLLFAADNIEKLSIDNITHNPQAFAQLICNWAETCDDSAGGIVGTIVAKAKIVNDIGKRGVTEKDIYNKLLELEKTGGENFDENAKNLLKYYKELNKLYADKPKVLEAIMNERCSFKSLQTKAAMLNTNIERIIELNLTGKTGDALDSAIKELMSITESPAEFVAIASYLKKINYPKSKLREVLQNIPEDQMGKLAAIGIALNQGQELGDTSNLIHEHGNKYQKNNWAECEKLLGKDLSIKASDEYIQKVKTENLINFISGVNERPEEESVEILHNAAMNPNNAPSKISFFTKTMVETATPDRQLYYAKNASNMGSAPVMEGLAAAEQNVDKSVRNEYSQYLDEALNSGSYTQEQVDIILKARSTGQTAAERGESYPEGFSTSSSSSSQGSNSTGKSSSSNSTGSSSKTSSSNKASGSGNSGSTSSANAAAKARAQAQAKAQQAYYEQVTKILEMRKEEALKKLTQIAENYQKSVKAREEKKAKEAQKTAETQKSNSTSKSSSTAKTSSSVQEKKTENEIIEKFASSEEVTSSISQDKREELRQAYQSGGAASLYDKLGSVSATYQDRFLNYFAEHANTADLCNFASAHSGNKNIILTLYQRSNEPALLRYLGEANMFDLLSKGKIKLQDFLKYASPDMVAKYMLSLKQTGNTGALKEVVSMMSFQQREETSQDFAAQVENKTPAKPLPGSDEYNDMLLGNMSKASTHEAAQNTKEQKSTSGMLKLDNEDKSTVGDGMLSLNEEEDYSGIAMGSNRVRMGLDIKKRDKRFLRMG